MFPLSKVSRLGDYGGDYLLSVRCLGCEHEGPLAAHRLARKLGRDARVTDVVKRLRCSRCGGKAVDVAVAGIAR